GGDQLQVVGRAADLLRRVLRKAAAEYDPRPARQPGQHRVENLAADVVYKDVHAAGSVLLQRGGDILGLVVDGRVEAEIGDNPAALVRATRDPDRPAPADLGNLPGHAADAAGRPRDDHSLALAQAADLQEAEVRGQARDAQRPQIGRQRCEQRVEPG